MSFQYYRTQVFIMCATDTTSHCNGLTDSEIRCNNYDHKGPREKYIVACMSDYRRG
jgi:hypothetical protein